MFRQSTTNASVRYQSHVRNVGWQSAVENGSLSGTTGRNLGLEAIRIDLDGQAVFRRNKNTAYMYRISAGRIR
ncbi:MAG: hypothetical protein ACLTLY_06045 [Agathobacter rectalis]